MFDLDPRWQAASLPDALIQIQAIALFFINLGLIFIEGGRRRVSSPAQPLIFGVLCILLTTGFSFALGADHLFYAFNLALAICLSLLRPIYAVCLFVSLYYLRPWEVLTSNELILALPRGVALLAMGRWAVDRIRAWDFRVRWNGPVVSILLLFVWLLMSTVKASDPGAAQNLFFDNFAKATIIFLLVLNTIENEWDELSLRTSLIVSTVSIGVAGLYLNFAMPDMGLDADGRLSTIGLLSNSNDIAAIMMPILPLTIVPFFRNPRFLKGLGTLFACGVLGAVIWFARSRGAILSIFAMGCAGGAVYFRWKPRTLVVLVLVALMAAPVMLKLGRSADDLDASTSSRVNYWLASFKMAEVNPLLGVGYSNFNQKFESYAPSIEFEWGRRTAHSTWFLILAEGGIPAFIFILSLFGTVFRQCFRARFLRPEFLYSLVGYGLAMSFLSHSYTIYPYILFALAYCGSRISLGHTTAAGTAPSPVPTDRYGKPALASLLILVFSAMGWSPGAHAASPFNSVILEGAEGGQKPLGAKIPPLASELQLKGARGETIDFVFRARGDDLALERISSHLPSPLRIRLFRMVSFRTVEPSFPDAFVGDHYDPLIPMADGTALSPTSATPKEAWIWGEVEIPADAKPGNYSGAVTTSGGAHLPLSLKVWKMKIPETPALPYYAEYGPFYGAIGHYGKWQQESEAELARKYIAEMLRHRIAPLKSWISRPPVTSDPSRPKLDLDAPNSRDSFASIYLDHFPSWPLITFPEWTESAGPGYWSALQNTLTDRKLRDRAMVYLWDEPHSWERNRLIKQSQEIRKSAPDLKILVTTPYSEELERHIDIFVPPLNALMPGEYPPPSTYRRLQSQGKQIWSYVSCISHGCESAEDPGYPDFMLDRATVYIRSIAWIARLEHLDGFLYYSVNNSYRFMPQKDPWNTVWDFTGNGDGTLFYPGRPGIYGLTEHVPIPSIRLKVWRESSFDAEYIHWMDALPHPPQWWPEEYEKLIRDPKRWSRNFSDYQHLRNRMGEYLDQNE